MLDQAVKNKLKEVFAPLKNKYTLKASVADGHPNKDELIGLLDDLASCSENIELKVEPGAGLGFEIIKNGSASNIIFKAVPTGHEFPSLLTAILNLEGIGKNLPDEAVANKIRSLKGELNLKSYISLSCTNCPEVVQALNVLSIINPNIKHEIIDGGIHQDEIEALGIQAVPTVYLDDEQLHVGRSSIGELLAKIEEKVGSEPVKQEAVEKEYDVVVVGGGPAGISAAVYSARKGFSVALVAEKVGGQVTETVSIENMISIPQTTGSELTANLMKHLKDYPVDILENRLVHKMELHNGYKHIKTTMGETLISPALIIATGASWRRLGVPGESDYIGSGVAFCTHCDGPFYKGKKVVVIGGGNSGLEAAIDLSSIASEVTVLEFMDELKGDQILQDKLKNLPNVRTLTSAQTLNIEGNGNKVTGLKFKHRESGKEESIQADGVFVQIGLQANSQVFSEAVDTNRMGEIEIDAHCRTRQAGIYAAGDVSVVPYKQIVIAMGEGSKAALSAFEDKIKNKLIAN